MKNLKRRCWKVAYREVEDTHKLPSAHGRFKTVKNPWWGWAADPFLFSHGGRLYLFAELFSYLKQKGTLGYCEFKNGEFGGWKVAIEEPFHLSYPNICEQEGEIYICPESYSSKKVSVYKAVEFPQKWEKAADIADGRTLSDTTFFKSEGKIYGFAFDHMAKPPELLMFKLVSNKAEFLEKPVSTDNSLARPGGKIFKTEEGDIRVGQNGEGMYGSGLAFLKMNFRYPEYSETLISRWSSSDIQLDFTPKNLRGLHTFNRACGYEVIDIMFLTAHPLDIAGRVIAGLKRRLRK